MRISWPERLTRNGDAPWLFETFFIAAVASFLGIRAFLAATGYPQIGANGLHIAHMLWGGALMLLAILLLLGFVNHSIQQLAAVVAGLGFGTFIDEIGKFVTADNDYFYRPAVALVYVAFVATFLVARVFVGRRRLSRREAISNALFSLAGLPASRIEPADRARIAALLRQADPKDEGTALIKQYLGLQSRAAAGPRPFAWLRDGVARTYETVMVSPLAERVLTIVVIVYAVAAVIGVGAIVMAAGSIDASATAQLGSTLVGAALVLIGAIQVPLSRVAAFRWMLRGLLVWVLVTQVFVFYSSQLAGLGGLALDLVAYGLVRYALARELMRA
jgi:hypothetical protein